MLILIFQKLSQSSSRTPLFNVRLESTLFKKFFFLLCFYLFYFLLFFYLLLYHFFTNEFLFCLKLFDSFSLSIFALLKKKLNIFECFVVEFGNLSPGGDERLKVWYLYEWNPFTYELLIKIVLMSHFEFKLN